MDNSPNQGALYIFDGKVLKRGQGINSNHFDIENGDEYWISGVKKNGAYRHWAGSGKVHIDKSAVNDYLEIIGQTALPQHKFILVDLNNVPNKELSNEIENSKLTQEPFNNKLLYTKTPKALSDDELIKVIAIYSEFDFTALPLKSRKEYNKKLKDLNAEQEMRNIAL